MSLFIQLLVWKWSTIILTKYSKFKSIDIVDSRKMGLFIYQTLKNRAIHILCELKKGAIRAACPYFTIWTASSEFGTYRLCEQWIKRNFQTENQIPGPSEWLDIRSWNLSWWNARRHKFAWRGPYIGSYLRVYTTSRRQCIYVTFISSVDGHTTPCANWLSCIARWGGRNK